MSGRADKPLSGARVLWGFVAAFGVVLAANGAMVYFALDSWTGLETQQYYEKGLAYNRVLEAVAAQKALGWRVRLDLEPLAGRRVRVALRLADRDGVPLTGAEATVRFVRPTSEGHDFDVPLEPRGGGRYRAEVEVPLYGVWDVRASIRHRHGRYQTTRRLVLRP